VALPNDGVPPDRFELRVRFVFGALLGALVGLRLAPATFSIPVVAIAAGAGAVLGGLLARHFGDRFWERFVRSLRWWP
jgi:hypothetical protein